MRWVTFLYALELSYNDNIDNNNTKVGVCGQGLEQAELLVKQVDLGIYSDQVRFYYESFLLKIP